MRMSMSSANIVQQQTGITIDCNVLDPKIIKKCDPTSSICESCRCSSDPNALLGCMECTEVTDANPYIVEMEDSNCTDPYHLIGGKCQLQNGHYCLPHKMTDIKCNEFQILIKKIEYLFSIRDSIKKTIAQLYYNQFDAEDIANMLQISKFEVEEYIKTLKETNIF